MYSFLLFLGAVTSISTISQIHRHLHNSTAFYYLIVSDNETLDDTKDRLLSYVSPCSTDRDPAVKIDIVNCYKNSPRSDWSRDVAKTFCPNKYAPNSLGESTSVLYVVEESCHCSVQCLSYNGGNDTIQRSPGCSCSPDDSDEISFDTALRICYFENCSWDISGFLIKEETFSINPYSEPVLYIYAETLLSSSNPLAFVESQYYQTTGVSCMVSFTYFLTQAISSSINVGIVARDADGQGDFILIHQIRGTTRTVRELKKVSVSIGKISEPTKLRIECVHGGNDTSAECALHDIELLACDDSYNHLDSCENMLNPYRCESKGHSICKADALCDGVRDCSNGQDEESCDGALNGSICNFHDHKCSSWEFLSTSKSFENFMTIASIHSPGKLKDSDGSIFEEPALVLDVRHGAGPFLIGSTLRAHFVNLTSGLFAYRSPIFPPTAQDERGLSCTLRFQFCYANSPDFKISTVEQINGKSSAKSIPFWIFKTVYTKTTCEWERISIPFPRQLVPFQIQISTYFNSDIKDTNYLFAVDDLSLSPFCFHEDSSLNIPDREVFHTCSDRIGEKPSYSKCLAERKAEGYSEVFLDENGKHKWKAAYSGQYWIMACGASGGWLLSGTAGKGSCLKVRLNLKAGSVLNMVIGQKGEDPCDEDNTLLFGNVCQRGNHNRTRFSTTGGGGGGAATIYNGTSMIMIAGGGGGGFRLEAHNNVTSGSVSVAGNGFSFSKKPPCSGICLISTPKTTASGGQCGYPDNDSSFGGFGGGGASCGPGGGGGAGYRGGEGGILGPGGSGSSLAKLASGDILMENGTHLGDGYIIIARCNISCTKPAKCNITSLDSGTVGCVCPSGRIVGEKSDCSQPEVIAKPEESFSLALSVLMVITILLTLVALSLWCSKDKQKVSKCIQWNRCLSSPPTGEVSVPLLKLAMAKGRLDAEDVERLLIGDDRFLRTLSNEELIRIVPKINRDSLKIIEQIGSGAFGTVSKASLQLDEGCFEVAAKELYVHYSDDECAAKRQFIMEAVLMRLANVKSDTTIHLVGATFEEQPYVIVMELMDGGNLLEFLRSCRATDLSLNPRKMTTFDLIRFTQDIVDACATIEELHYVHRDLAARNCLLTHQGTGMRVKVGDFGLAKELYSVYRSSMSRDALPIKWLPPEAIEDALYNSKTDVWSFGVVCWEIFSLGKVPYPGETALTVLDLLRTGYRMEAPVGTPSMICQMMRECWNIRFDERPTFAALKELIEDIAQDPEVLVMPFPSMLDSRPPLCESPIQCMDTPCTVETDIATPTNAIADSGYFDRTGLVPYTATRSQDTSITLSSDGSMPTSDQTVICNRAYMVPDNSIYSIDSSNRSAPKRPDQLFLPRST